ncbi:MAG: SGNH/GDSL hydrolase family protein [Nitrospiraceae bacterium]
MVELDDDRDRSVSRQAIAHASDFDRPAAPDVRRPVPKRLFYAVLVAFVGLAILGMAEAGARLAFKFKHYLSGPVDPRSYSLNPYEMVDPKEPRNWILRPSTTWSIKALEGSRAVLSDAQLEKAARQHSIDPDDVIFRVNHDGFKGPELNTAHNKVRILTLGDSCTFGSLVDRFSYPRTIETRLRAQGVDAEVVNGGVKGYTPWNILLRINQFKALKPEIVTIYAGWNGIYTFEAIGEQRWLQSPLLFEIAWSRLYTKMVGQQNAALAAYQKEKKPDRHSVDTDDAGEYKPSFVNQMELIVKEMQTIGSRVALVTLPGLYSMDEWPSEQALKIGHLPVYTDNPFVLARVTQQYNQALRELARTHDVPLIDLEAWAKETFQPVDAYFVDSVHLTDEGQQMIGVFLASKLVKLYPELLRLKA